jgi:hypothetical protein
MISDKAIEKITPEDLELLVANGVSESRSLEYKETLPGGTDQEKREFLADVSSFANAIGGDLVFGAREARDESGKPTGTPETVVGLELANTDQAIQRLENVLRDGLAPRISGVRFQTVGRFERGPAIVVRVPRSWAGPHMVAFQQSGKFFTRHSGGKHQLDINELRDSFLNSHSASERAESFRTTRLGRIIGGGAPIQLSSEKVLCIHAIPHGALFGALEIDLQKAATSTGELRPIEAQGWGPRFNIDGVISIAAAPRNEKRTGYVQLFRNGIVEIAFSEVYFEPPPDMRTAVAGVGAGHVAQELASAFQRTVSLFRILEVPPPISWFTSLHGMSEVAFHTSQRLARSGSYAFDRDTILLPEIVLMDYAEPVLTTIRPALDALWQAAGLERCLDYTPDGRWAPQT